MSDRLPSCAAAAAAAVVLLMLWSCSNDLPALRSDGAVRVTPGQDLGGESDQNACLSSDEQQLVFTRFHRGYNHGPSALMMLDLRTGVETVLLDDEDHDYVDLPGRCFSPDGRQLALSSDVSGNDEIHLLSLETGDLAQVTTTTTGSSAEPSFVSDGLGLVFQRGESGAGEIWRVGLDGASPQALSTGADDRQPSASPTDGPVIFQSDRGGDIGLWQVSAAGGEATVLWNTSAEETDASWSADGLSVVFATDDCDALSCASVLLDGQQTTWDTPSGWYDGAPTLAGDGTIYVEAAPGDPDRGHETAIYRLPPKGDDLD